MTALAMVSVLKENASVNLDLPGNPATSNPALTNVPAKESANMENVNVKVDG
jgi:hypothetical protein